MTDVGLNRTGDHARLPESDAVASRGGSWRRVVHLGDVCFLALLTLITGLFARPLLEEWGFFETFNARGLGVYPELASKFPLRPLQAVPVAVQWAFSGGRSAGFALGYLVLLVAKYATARWAVSRVLPPQLGWLVAVLATLLVPWEGQWHMRYSAAQLSEVFCCLALGAVLRLQRRLRWGWVVVGAASVLLMLATYQALAVVVLLLPLVGLCVPNPTASPGFLRRVLVGAAPVVIGLAAYAVYSVVIDATVGTSGYEGDLVQQSGLQLSSAEDVGALIGTLYSTAYRSFPVSVALFGALLVAVVPPAGAVDESRWSMAQLGLVASTVLLLPLLGLPYAVSAAFLGDPERVGFPVATGFVLVLTACALLAPDRISWRRSGALVAALLITTTFAAANAYRDYALQRDVLVQAGALARQDQATDVLVRDHTGRLGDVYTGYSTLFGSALRARGVPVEALICTPLEVDRVHPVARRLQIASTPRCEEVPPVDHPRLVLDAVAGSNGILLTPAG